jgi:uncharacterized membrane protein YphA (DoxX/SURF4 family)
MLDARTLIRPLLATPFVVGGLNALRSPTPTAKRAAGVAVPIAEAVGLPTNPETLVKVNAGIQIGAAAALVLGLAPRAAALLLGASLVPTTLAGHRFWEERERPARTAQLVQFGKNAGLLGGLLAAALDTGGRPSLFWSGRRAAERAAHSVADTVSGAYRALPVVA